MEIDWNATRAVASVLKGREPGSLEWRDSGEDNWLVGTFAMNNDAKFEVQLKNGKYELARTWFYAYNQGEPHPPKELGEFDTREAVEDAIRQSLSETNGDGPWTLHYEEK